MSAVETTAVRTARRQLATYFREPTDNACRQDGRTRTQTRILEQDSSTLVRNEARDEVEEPIRIYESMEKGEVEHME